MPPQWHVTLISFIKFSKKHIAHCRDTLTLLLNLNYMTRLPTATVNYLVNIKEPLRGTVRKKEGRWNWGPLRPQLNWFHLLEPTYLYTIFNLKGWSFKQVSNFSSPVQSILTARVACVFTFVLSILKFLIT